MRPQDEEAQLHREAAQTKYDSVTGIQVDGESWEVEALLGKRRVVGGRLEYLVRWQGWTPQWDLWVERRNIAPALVAAY